MIKDGHANQVGARLFCLCRYVFQSVPLGLARLDKREHVSSDGAPCGFDEKEVDRLFEMAELCNFTAEQFINYQESQKMIYDYGNTIDFARQQGR